jgi:multiple sugar transport system substrate-binding protein
MRNRWALSSLVLVLMLALVTGCSKSDAGKSSTDGDQVTLKFYSWYKLEGDNFDKVIAAFEKKHPGIRIDFVSLTEKSDANEYLKKLDLAAAANDQIDVMIFPDAVNYAQRVKAGMVVPLDDFINEEGFNYSDEYKFDTQFENKHYALPGKYIDWMVLLNKKHLDEAGLEVPKEWTWDEFLEYSKALTKGEGTDKRYGAYFQNWGQFFQLAQMNSPEESGLVTTSGKLNVNTDRIRKSLEILNQAENVDKSAMPYANIISQKMAYRNVYFGEQASMIVMGNWMIQETAGGNPQFPVTFETVFAPFPKYSDADENGWTIANGDFISVAEKSKHQKEAYTFARWLSTEGLVESGKFITSWKKADQDKNLADNVSVGSSPETANLDSLKQVTSVAKPAPLSGMQPYYNEAQNAYIAEAEKYLLGNQDLEKTISNAETRLQEIVEANQ